MNDYEVFASIMASGVVFIVAILFLYIVCVVITLAVGIVLCCVVIFHFLTLCFWKVITKIARCCRRTKFDDNVERSLPIKSWKEGLEFIEHIPLTEEQQQTQSQNVVFPSQKIADVDKSKMFNKYSNVVHQHDKSKSTPLITGVSYQKFDADIDRDISEYDNVPKISGQQLWFDQKYERKFVLNNLFPTQ